MLLTEPSLPVPVVNAVLVHEEVLHVDGAPLPFQHWLLLLDHGTIVTVADM